MGYEVIAVIALMIGGTMTIKRIINEHKEPSAPIGVAIVFCIALFAFASFICENTIITEVSLLKSVTSQPAQTVDEFYAIKNKNSDVYTFVYDGDIIQTARCLIIDIEKTSRTEPTIILCKPKWSLWTPLICTLSSSVYYVIIAPPEAVKNAPEPEMLLPEWI